MSNSRIILYSIFLATLLAIMVLWISSVLAHGEDRCDDGWAISHSDSCDRTNLYREQGIYEQGDQRHFHCYHKANASYGVLFPRRSYAAEDFGSPCKLLSVISDSPERNVSVSGDSDDPHYGLTADEIFLITCLQWIQDEKEVCCTSLINDWYSPNCCRIKQEIEVYRETKAAPAAVRHGKLAISWAALKRGVR